ncbi:MAG: rod shape-determining protein MreC [candidate division NC10 bacterium]|nr:rod shape-determining protein MreC [candidate division NC10 bacterium]
MFLRFILRHRQVAVLSTILLFSFLLLTFQVRQVVPAIDFTRKVLLISLSPFLRATTFVVSVVTSVWEEYIDLRNLRQENRRLKEELERLKGEVKTFRESELENQRLRTLLELKGQTPTKVIAARVIGKDATNWFKTIVIDRGSESGVRRNMVVIAPGGLVGRILEAMPFSSRAQLLTDPASAAGALVQRSRTTGVVAGYQGLTTRLKYLPLFADVAMGDEVLTSGMGGIFPKGIPIGKVAWVRRPTGALFLEAEVTPWADFSKLEEVLVLAELPGQETAWNPSQGNEGHL